MALSMEKRCWSDLVSAITVSEQKGKQLWGLLTSLKRQTYQQLEKIVVLNNASAQDITQLKGEFTDVNFISNQKNLLFSQAHNQGIRAARGEFILCLNDDLTLEDDFIEEMVRAIKKDVRIGMVSGCILRRDKGTVDTTGLFLARSRRPRERGYAQKRNGRYKRGEYIFGVGGVAPLYRRKMLENIKLGNEYFDEDYGMFYEDLDIAWRARNRSWQGYYTPQALAYHSRGGTAKKVTPRFSFLRKYDFAYLSGELKLRLLKNRYMTIIKNDSLKQLLLNSPWVLAYELKIWLYLIFFEPILLVRFFKDLSFIKIAWQKRNDYPPKDRDLR